MTSVGMDIGTNNERGMHAHVDNPHAQLGSCLLIFLFPHNRGHYHTYL